MVDRGKTIERKDGRETLETVMTEIAGGLQTGKRGRKGCNYAIFVTGIR